MLAQLLLSIFVLVVTAVAVLAGCSITAAAEAAADAAADAAAAAAAVLTLPQRQV